MMRWYRILRQNTLTGFFTFNRFSFVEIWEVLPY